MTETITIQPGPKPEVYEQLIPQIVSLMDDSVPATANMANMTSALKQAFARFSWVGFYLRSEGDLILGPFQGKPACVRIAPGRGVCGTAFARREAIVVADVHSFPGHIACDADSRSEIVVPLLDGDVCYGVLDIDSYEAAAFDEIDVRYLSRIAERIVPFLRKEHADV